MATITILFGEKTLGNYQMSKGDTVLIGRNKINDIVIDNLAVSSQHAKIETDGGGYLYVDLQSENGSFVRNKLIKSYWLNDGDEVMIGKHILKFSDPKIMPKIEKKSALVNKTMQMDTRYFRDMIKKNRQKLDNDKPVVKGEIKPSFSSAVLAFLSDDRKDLALDKKTIRIGKDPNSDILIKSLRVGKTAAVINKLPDGWYISSIGGISKPRLNKKIIKKNIKLCDLDIISVGPAKLQFLILYSKAES